MKPELFESLTGAKYWYVDGKLHREDGPAIIWADGSKFWFVNGEKHRDNGPAVIWADGTKEWWLNDKRVTILDVFPNTTDVFDILRHA